MNHAITVGGLLLSIGVLAGIGCIAFGVTSAFANMMADAQGDNGKQGCITIAIGAVLLGGCLFGLIW